jgi:Phage integrase family
LYEGLADRYVMPVIGGLRLDKLTPAHVQRLVTETRNGQTSRGTPPSASTLRHVYKLIRNALGDAYRMELVTRNVAMQVKAPPLSKERRVALDMAEAKRLLDVINGERLEALYVLALKTGLRRGELLALRWDDINFGLGNFTCAGPCSGSAANFRLSSRRPAARGGRWCCPGSRCAISRSTRNGRTRSARRWVRPGGSTGWCSPRPSVRRSSRATSTGAGMICGGRLACPGSGCMTCGTGVPRCCEGCSGSGHYGGARARRDRCHDEHLRACPAGAASGGGGRHG